MLVIDAPPLAQLRERRSAKWRTFAPDVLPLWIAEMDYPLAEPVAEALADAVRRSDTGYPAFGPELVEAVVGFAARRWGWAVEPDHVSFAADVSVASVELLRRVVSPGDAVVISPPVYHPFFSWVPEVGARLVEAPLRAAAEGWRLDLGMLESTFAAGARAYLLCNPHNPVGRVHERSELVELARLAAAYDVAVISDEIHAPLVLRGATHTPFLTVSDEARRHGFSVMSASKAWNLAGLKCAAIVTADAATREAARRLPEDVQWRTGHFGVLATIAAYTRGEQWLDAVLDALDTNRRYLAELLAAELPEAGYRIPEATYLAWLDLRALGWGDDPAAHLVDVARVALSPGPAFGSGSAGFARLNFATSRAVLDEAVERMARARAGSSNPPSQFRDAIPAADRVNPCRSDGRGRS